MSATKYSYSCAMVLFPSNLLKEYQKKINPEDVYDTEEEKYGLEDEPHITILYGLHTTSITEVQKALQTAGLTSVKVKLKETSLFENEKFDVLKISVESPDLFKLNKALRSELEYTSDFPDYKPHLTIAYLKKGRGKKYAGDNYFAGKVYDIESWKFSPSVGPKGVLPIILSKEAALVKQALQIERRQHEEGLHQVQKPTAVIIKGNPAYITNNPQADRFYNQLADHMRKQNYAVSFDKGEDYTTPAKADVWIGHSRGGSGWAFRNPPEGTKTIRMGSLGGVNHPMDRSLAKGAPHPDIFHFMLTEKMKDELNSRLK